MMTKNLITNSTTLTSRPDNLNIKIVRLVTGEDVLADFIEDSSDGTALLSNPMRLVFKRMPTGQNAMHISPWLPIELIEENIAQIHCADILTVVNPKEELVDHYNTIVDSEQNRLILQDEQIRYALNRLREEEIEEYDEMVTEVLKNNPIH
jgi:hypothetical protein